MERIITYKIDNDHQNMTILQFLKQKLYTDKAIIALKKTPEGIRKNGVWAYVSDRISSGDILTIKLLEADCSENIVPEKLPLDIVYEDEDILVVNKPHNMPVHPSQNHHTGTLANAAAYYFMMQQKPFVFRCVNRLDKDTTGLTILCKHQLASGIMSNMVAGKYLLKDHLASKEPEKLLQRTYLALCTDNGSLPSEGIIDAPIGRKDGSTIERMVDYVHGERSVTHFKRLQHNAEKGISLVRLRLETGRTHQIRVHMKAIGHPLLGDDLYGGDLSLITRQALHSYSLRFVHPVTLQEMYLEQPLPEDMALII